LSEKEKQITAYHEGGHAMLHFLLEYAVPAHKITIIPRGRALGYVMSLPEEDRYMRSREEFEDELCVLMGGRAAEEIVYNQFTTGASSDLQRSTSMARSMVTLYGMSEALGPRTFGGGTGTLFLGRDMYEQRDYSEQAAEEIDNEVKRIVQTQYQRAKQLLLEYREKLEALAQVLIEQETIERTQFEEMMGKSPDAKSADAPLTAFSDLSDQPSA
jgi:cell division protease FtsH